MADRQHGTTRCQHFTFGAATALAATHFYEKCKVKQGPRLKAIKHPLHQKKKLSPVSITTRVVRHAAYLLFWGHRRNGISSCTSPDSRNEAFFRSNTNKRFCHASRALSRRVSKFALTKLSLSPSWYIAAGHRAPKNDWKLLIYPVTSTSVTFERLEGRARNGNRAEPSEFLSLPSLWLTKRTWRKGYTKGSLPWNRWMSLQSLMVRTFLADIS